MEGFCGVFVEFVWFLWFVVVEFLWSFCVVFSPKKLCLNGFPGDSFGKHRRVFNEKKMKSPANFSPTKPVSTAT